jgi:hypothetical protein
MAVIGMENSHYTPSTYSKELKNKLREHCRLVHQQRAFFLG